MITIHNIDEEGQKRTVNKNDGKIAVIKEGSL